jgi:hypothetical protein
MYLNSLKVTVLSHSAHHCFGGATCRIYCNILEATAVSHSAHQCLDAACISLCIDGISDALERHLPEKSVGNGGHHFDHVMEAVANLTMYE